MIGPVTLSSSDKALAIEEIERVFSTLLRALYEKYWDSYSTLHPHDVLSETRGGLAEGKRPQVNGRSNRVAGPERFTAAFRGRLGGPTHVTTVHQGHSPETVRTTDTTATGIRPMKHHRGRHGGIPLWIRPLPQGISTSQRAVTDHLPQAPALAGDTQSRIHQLSDTALNGRPP